VLVYLDDEDGATRKDAALCCCKLVADSFSGMTSTQFGSIRWGKAMASCRGGLVSSISYLLMLYFC
jgi:hypothetical protein